MCACEDNFIIFGGKNVAVLGDLLQFSTRNVNTFYIMSLNMIFMHLFILPFIAMLRIMFHIVVAPVVFSEMPLSYDRI